MPSMPAERAIFRASSQRFDFDISISFNFLYFFKNVYQISKVVKPYYYLHQVSGC